MLTNASKLYIFLAQKILKYVNPLDGVKTMTIRILPKDSTNFRPVFRHLILSETTEKRPLTWSKATMRPYRKLDVYLTNVLFDCWYPRDQLDSCKVEVLFHALKYLDIKWYICEQEFVMYQWAVILYHKVQGEDPSSMEVATATLHALKSKTLYYICYHHHAVTVITTETIPKTKTLTTAAPIWSSTKCALAHKPLDRFTAMTPHTPNTVRGTICQFVAVPVHHP